MACGATEKANYENPNQITKSLKINNIPSINLFKNESYNNFMTEKSRIDSVAFPAVTRETNPFLKVEATKVPGYFFPREHGNLPEIDKSLFEVEEPELINIFKEQSLLKNPSTQPCFRNPFKDDFVSNSCAVSKNTNPFKVEVLDDSNLYRGISEDIRISKLDSSEWKELDKLFQKVLSSKLL